MKKCLCCGRENVKNGKHDICYDCWLEKEADEKLTYAEETFEQYLDSGLVYSVYIMFYGKKNHKIGYTNNLNARLIELKREYPNNKLVYFREFSLETRARRYENWLKGLTDRDRNKIIGNFQDKMRKVEDCY